MTRDPNQETRKPKRKTQKEEKVLSLTHQKEWNEDYISLDPRKDTNGRLFPLDLIDPRPVYRKKSPLNPEKEDQRDVFVQTQLNIVSLECRYPDEW